MIWVFADLSKFLLKEEIVVCLLDRWQEKEVSYECTRRICTRNIYTSINFLNPTLWLSRFIFLASWAGRIWGCDGVMQRLKFLLSSICRDKQICWKYLQFCMQFSNGTVYHEDFLHCINRGEAVKSSSDIHNEMLFKNKSYPIKDVSHQTSTRWTFLITAYLSSSDSLFEISACSLYWHSVNSRRDAQGRVNVCLIWKYTHASSEGFLSTLPNNGSSAGWLKRWLFLTGCGCATTASMWISEVLLHCFPCPSLLHQPSALPQRQ